MGLWVETQSMLAVYVIKYILCMHGKCFNHYNCIFSFSYLHFKSTNVFFINFESIHLCYLLTKYISKSKSYQYCSTVYHFSRYRIPLDQNITIYICGVKYYDDTKLKKNTF